MAHWYGKQCSCGRIMKKMHCSACGSTNLHGLAKQSRHPVQDDSGLVFEQIFKTYRCRACAEVSDEWVTLNHCTAPKLEALVSRPSGPILPRENRREKIEEVLRLAGLNPHQKTGESKKPIDYVDKFFSEKPE